MRDFDKVSRYWPDEMVYRDRWEQASMLDAEDGGWVEYEAYDDLLQAYKELKWRMDQLEK